MKRLNKLIFEVSIKKIIQAGIIYIFLSLYSYISFLCLNYVEYWNFKVPMLLLMTRYILRFLIKDNEQI